MTNEAVLIVGANSEIAKALARDTVTAADRLLIVVSRNVEFYQQPMFSNAKIISIKSYEEAEIELVVEQIKQTIDVEICYVFSCHGVLHDHGYQPEKRLEDFSVDAFMQVINANTIVPMLWLKHLAPILNHKKNCKITVFSARVGSISDNELGGWYSYRASKAAMNMLIKSAAIELARKSKNIKLISFHPGTTDTPLSKPFQKNVPKGKLFTPDFVAQQLLQIVDNTEIDGQASFLDWQGNNIPW